MSGDVLRPPRSAANFHRSESCRSSPSTQPVLCEVEHTCCPDLTGYRLTELGEESRPFAERVEEAIAAFERHLVSSDKELTGTIRVTCPTTVADRLLRTPLVDAFHKRYSGLRVEFVVSDQCLDLSTGEADIAIRAGEPDDEALVGRTIAEMSWALYASRSYFERHGRLECPKDIERHLVVAYDGAMANYPAFRWLRSVAPGAPLQGVPHDYSGLVLDSDC